MQAESLTRPRLLAPPRRLLAALSDERLAAEAKRGNDAAFEVIYDRHHRGLLALCRHILGSREDAEDALQQTLASAFRALQSDQQPAQVKPWLYAIARNRCLTMLRARRETPVEEVDRDPTAGLSEQVERRTELRELLTDLDHLPERQKTALVLSEVGDLAHPEIAQVLECETTQVKALVFQARSALIEDRRAREIPCAQIREQLATASGGELRRSFLRRHVRVCSGCAEFRDEVRCQRRMLAVALPVVPSFGLKESALAAAGTGGGGAAGGGGLIAALGAHGAAKVAAIAIATAGTVGGVAVTHPGVVSKAQGALGRVAGEDRGGVAEPSVGSRRGPTAGRANGAPHSGAASLAARKKGRRSETSAAGDRGADERKGSPSRERSRGGEGHAPKPKDRPDGQSPIANPKKDRGRGRRGASAPSNPNRSSRGGDDKGRGRTSSKPPKARGTRRPGSSTRRATPCSSNSALSSGASAGQEDELVATDPRASRVLRPE